MYDWSDRVKAVFQLYTIYQVNNVYCFTYIIKE